MFGVSKDEDGKLCEVFEKSNPWIAPLEDCSMEDHLRKAISGGHDATSTPCGKKIKATFHAAICTIFEPISQHFRIVLGLFWSRF